MIATSDDRSARWRAKSGRVEVREAQAISGHPIKGGRRNHTAERARDAEASVVGHNQEDVRRARGRHHACWPPGGRLRGVALDLAFELLRRRRQLVAWDCRCSAGRARRSGNFLCVGSGSQRCGGKKGKRHGKQVVSSWAELRLKFALPGQFCLHVGDMDARRCTFGVHLEADTLQASARRGSRCGFQLIEKP